jgi:hypothetical protein
MSVKRLVPLHAIALTDNPENSRIGDIYYNTVAEELRFFDGSAWNAVGSGTITGLLDHIHTYDGEIFSVDSIEVPASGVVDGGTP